MDKIIQSLHPLERKVINHLKNSNLMSSISQRSGLSDVETMRALQWLENKDLITLKATRKELVSLDQNGELYVKHGLPERKFLKLVSKGVDTIKAMMEKSDMQKEEINIALGMLKSKAAISLAQGKIVMNEPGKKLLDSESFEEKLLKKLENGPVSTDTLDEGENFALQNLKKRKDIIKIQEAKDWEVHLTDLGKDVTKKKIDDIDFTERLTPEMIRDGSWKGKEFRRYDVSINVPKVAGGKRHFVYQAIEYAKRIWLDMGFEEMSGPLLDTSFWVFDALFTPQDHPVREMQDTFFIEDPYKGNLPDKRYVDDVKKSHESGIAGSQGWQYKWDPEEAKKNVMRTHTTGLSARTLAGLRQLKDMKAGKYFVVGRNFRNETVDATHLFEFNQTDGIVVDPDANFRNLLGYLKQFFKKMGYPDARFRPAFFSYTEPSVEIDVYHPVHKKWIELGGAGIFRPEVVVPLLGKDIPVLAWGPGFDRIYLEYFEVNDIRDLYRNDLKKLRDMKSWMK